MRVAEGGQYGARRPIRVYGACVRARDCSAGYAAEIGSGGQGLSGSDDTNASVLPHLERTQ